ncbi:MAG: pyruvate kinase [Candidatus Woesearchaeota archaeon]
MKAIVTIPPHAPFIWEVLQHPSVEGIRLNTVMPVKGSLEDLLKRLDNESKDKSKELWIDLKCRQLRVVGYWVPPYTEVRLSHNLQVNTPVTAYFGGGREPATVLEVDGDRLIMQEGPSRVVGPGESINIISPTLSIDGYLTETDKRYIESGIKVGANNYMLSYVEQPEDVQVLSHYVGDANIVAKIESRKGLDYVKNEWKGSPRLMAARGDLFVEVRKPHEIIAAVELIAKKDPQAIAASRIFTSLATSLEPSCEDIGDVDNLMRIGYRHFMFGDDICMRRDSIISGLNLFQAIAEKYV